MQLADKGVQADGEGGAPAFSESHLQCYTIHAYMHMVNGTKLGCNREQIRYFIYMRIVQQLVSKL